MRATARTVVVCDGCGSDRLLPLTFEAVSTLDSRFRPSGVPHFKCLSCGRRQFSRAARETVGFVGVYGDIQGAWAPTHRLHFPHPNDGHIDIMCIPNLINGGRDGFTQLDWRPDATPGFSVTDDGEWYHDGLPFVGRVEVL